MEAAADSDVADRCAEKRRRSSRELDRPRPYISVSYRGTIAQYRKIFNYKAGTLILNELPVNYQ